MLESRANGLPDDDDERGQCPDAEALDEIGPRLVVDAVELEGAVVAPALEHLGQEPLDTPARAGDGRVEEDESRLVAGRREGSDGFDLLLSGSAGACTCCLPGRPTGLTSVQPAAAAPRLQ